MCLKQTDSPGNTKATAKSLSVVGTPAGMLDARVAVERQRKANNSQPSYTRFLRGPLRPTGSFTFFCDNQQPCPPCLPSCRQREIGKWRFRALPSTNNSALRTHDPWRRGHAYNPDCALQVGPGAAPHRPLLPLSPLNTWCHAARPLLFHRLTEQCCFLCSLPALVAISTAALTAVGTLCS